MNDFLKSTEQCSAAKALSSSTSSNAFFRPRLASVLRVTSQPQTTYCISSSGKKSIAAHPPRKSVAFDTGVQMWKERSFLQKLNYIFSLASKEPATIHWHLSVSARHHFHRQLQIRNFLQWVLHHDPNSRTAPWMLVKGLCTHNTSVEIKICLNSNNLDIFKSHLKPRICHFCSRQYFIQRRKIPESGIITAATSKSVLDYHPFGHNDVCHIKTWSCVENNTKSIMQYVNEAGKKVHIPPFCLFLHF